jgi:hypothetical protein
MYNVVSSSEEERDVALSSCSEVSEAYEMDADSEEEEEEGSTDPAHVEEQEDATEIGLRITALGTVGREL